MKRIVIGRKTSLVSKLLLRKFAGRCYGKVRLEIGSQLPFNIILLEKEFGDL